MLSLATGAMLLSFNLLVDRQKTVELHVLEKKTGRVALQLFNSLAHVLPMQLACY